MIQAPEWEVEEGWSGIATCIVQVDSAMDAYGRLHGIWMDTTPDLNVKCMMHPQRS
jgi:hypothetical protein